MTTPALVAIVTGASKGIGYACAKILRDRGYSLLICARNQAEIEAAVKSLRGQVSDGQEIHGISADVGYATDCERIVQSCIGLFGRVDVLVNNAAIYTPCEFLEITPEHWDQTLDIDLRGPVLLSVAAGRHMRDQGGGRIVHVSSINAQVSEPDFAAYNAAKAGLLGLTRSMAIDLARYNIITNCVLPGWVRTSLTEEYLKTVSTERIEKVIPVGRVAEPDDIAEVVAMLCDPGIKYLNGQAITVDGGFLSKQPAP